MLAVFAIIGCKSPQSFPYRTFYCLPNRADASALEYWQSCGEGKTTSTNSSEVSPPSSGDLEPTLLTLASHQQSPDQVPPMPPETLRQQIPLEDRGPLSLPSELPGADTEPLVVPGLRDLNVDEQRQVIRNLFPELRDSKTEAGALPQSIDSRIGLESLHQLAYTNHPSLRAAAANVESTRGQMIQAGLPPNPKVGYQADTVNTIFTQGYQGAYLTQTIVTARKLGLAAEAAAVDYANAVVNQRKIWVQVTSNIRRAYFQTLAARERVRLAKALYDLTGRAFNAQVDLVSAGEAAPYEPLQLRVLTTQARATLVRAEQDAIASWRVLAAAIGMPDLEVAAIDGSIDCAVPNITYDQALERLTAVHTDIQMAQNLVRKQQTLVTLADRTPIPNLDLEVVVQRDHTFDPGTNTYNLLLGGDVPVLNRNQGNRIATRAELVRAGQQVAEVRLNLISDLATTYGVYRANRELADSFKTEGLSDQVRAYRGVYQRYLADPNGVSFNDVIVAQQTLASVLTQYLDILQSQWQSVVDLGELLQVEDLFQMGPISPVAQIPSLD
jgi:cobalt-zinc-cadmium efflux system outer membrane protein